MALTLKQIAALAGVSRGTVDRVLKNRGGVAPATEQEIRAIVERHHYRPNRAGAALARVRRPVRVAVLLNAVGNPFFDSLKRGVRRAEEEYRDYGLQLTLEELRGYDLEAQLNALARIAETRPRGVLFTPINAPEVAAAVDGLTERGTSVATVNSDLEGSRRLFYVGCDYYRSGQTAAQLLGMVCGKSARVAAVTGSKRMLGHNRRIAGLRDTLRQNFPSMEFAGAAECGDDEETAYRVTGELLDRLRPNALYVAAGGVPGAVRAVAERGERLVVVTHDVTPETVLYLEQGLVSATISQQPYEQGYRAVKRLFLRILGGEEADAPELDYTELSVKTRYTV